MTRPTGPEDDYLWDPTAPVDSEIQQLEALLRPLRSDVAMPTAFAATAAATRKPSALPVFVRWSLAASMVAVALLGAREFRTRVVRPWHVTAVNAGSGSTSGKSVGAIERDQALAPGMWIDTDSTTAAQLNVGSIGRAVIAPGSRVQVERIGLAEHRLRLAYGELSAKIWAPPRFFQVETSSGVAVDLGCVYSLRVDRDGSGELHVQSGEVEFTGDAGTALVPAGNIAPIWPRLGAGLPMPEEADSAYRALAAVVDTGTRDMQAVEALLRASDKRHSITLWHLLDRVDAETARHVVERLLALTPPPEQLSRAAIKRMEPATLATWRAIAADSWSAEGVSLWKRFWRRLWS